MGLQQVHLRINDAATGQPTPVRLRITDADGNYHAPFGRLTEFATGVNQDVGGNVLIGNKKWCYIDGACEILLPPGQLHIEITKGFEYKPIDETITLLPGKMSLRLTIERWCDMRKEGWYSGDTRVHFMTPDAALLEGQAEDVAVVNVLIEEFSERRVNKRYAIPNILSFSGQSFARQAETCSVAVNTHNRHLFLGSLGLLHCHRIVYPLTFGSPEGMDDWTLADWCDQCHRKKGMVVWTHPYELSADFNYGEPLADLVLGRIDAYEVSYSDAPRHMEDYYDLCRAGLIVPLVGASAKGDNCAVLGAMRTYASIDNSDDLGYENWLRAIRAGRSFATNGPLLSLKINGSVPTATLDIAEAVENVHVHIEAISLVPFQSVELLWNGHVVASSMAALELPCKANLDYDLPTNRSGWLAVRCRGTALLPNSRQDNVREVFAHTTAIAVRKEGSPFVAEATVIDRFLEELDSMLDWTENKALCSTQRDRDRLRYIFEEARTVLAKKLS